MDGADASTTFLDSGNGGTHLWTAHGTAQIDGNEGLFDGNSDWIDTPDSNDWAFGTGDFTIDFWVRFNALPADGAYQIIATQYQDINNRWSIFLGNASGAYAWSFVSYGGTGGGTIEVGKFCPGLTTGVWYHIAIVRNGNIFKIFQDGTQCGTDVTDADAVGNNTGLLYIGKFGTYATPAYFNGRLKEVRISKGIARWIGDFTKPTEAYKTNAEDDATWYVWTSFGSHWDVDAIVYDSYPKSATCKTFIADESSDNLRGISKDVTWGSIKMTGKCRTSNVASATCQTGCYYPLSSNGHPIQALQFGASGHFTYNDGVNPNHLFPNDKTYIADTWYLWEVIFDFTNSLQKTKVDGVDLGDITLKDELGNTLGVSDTLTKLRFVGSSDVPVNNFNIDSIEVYSYPGNIQLFRSYFEATQFSEDLSDSFYITDSEINQPTLNKSDSFTLLDGFSALSAFTRSIPETLSLSDDHFLGIGLSKSDTISLSDVFSKISDFILVCSDTLSFSDNIVKSFNKCLADAFSLLDSICKSSGLSRSDAISLVDSVSKTILLPKSDTLILTDSFSKSASFFRLLLDILHLSDSIVWPWPSPDLLKYENLRLKVASLGAEGPFGFDRLISSVVEGQVEGIFPFDRITLSTPEVTQVIDSEYTAFQDDAFQDDAFQIEYVVPDYAFEYQTIRGISSGVVEGSYSFEKQKMIENQSSSNDFSYKKV
jgi:hypothetical protein